MNANHLTTPYTAPQFERRRNGSLYHRGGADRYYGRRFEPHWYPAGTYNGDPVYTDEPSEVAEYKAGWDDCTDEKDWG